jgi:hypothetical protein
LNTTIIQGVPGFVHAADLELDRHHARPCASKSGQCKAAIITRPKRARASSGSQRTIDGGALAAGKRCDGCTATGRGDGGRAGGGRSTARVLTVVVKLLLDLFWIFKCMALG